MRNFKDYHPPGLDVREIFGSNSSDFLTGTTSHDDIFSRGGKLDFMLGRGGIDHFIFGKETDNGAREMDVVLDYEVGQDALEFVEGARPVFAFEVQNGVMVVTGGDNDLIFVRGPDLTVDDLIFEF